MSTSEIEKQKQQQRQKLKRIYITLVLSGLAMGGVVSIGVVTVLQRLGLTQPPSQTQIK